MKKLIIILALFAASGVMESQAQYRPQVVVNINNDYYRDGRGAYRWETRPRRVWIPEHYVGGFLGIGSRRVPGHYEVVYERVKVYTNSYNRKGHPHGMPPGQRKKMHHKGSGKRW